MIDSPLLELLADLRRRLWLFCGLSALAWGMLAAVAVVTFGAWGDLVFDFSPWLRLGILLTSGAAAVALLTSGIHTAWRQGRLGALARRLDSTGPSRGEILAGVDLACAPPSKAAVNALTHGLARIAVEQAAQVAQQIPDEIAVPARPVGQAFGVLAGALLACGLVALTAPRMVGTEWNRFLDPFGDHPPYTAVEFHVMPGDAQVLYGRGTEIAVEVAGDDVQRVELVLQTEGAKTPETLPMFLDPGGKRDGEASSDPKPVWKASVANVTQAMTYHVRSGHARSRHYRLTVVTVPRLESVRFEITPPAYTQRPPYRGPLPSQGIAGLPGTAVRFWGKSNRPLSGGEAQVTSSETKTIAMVPGDVDPTEVSGSFAITAAGKLSFVVVDREGQKSEERFTAPITLLKDERPSIRLAQPREISFATPSASLPVVISAEDDFGIAKVQIYRSLNDSRYSPAEVEVASPPPTRWQTQIMLPFSSYGLVPGDVVKLFARVEDNRPDSPQGAESEIATVRIIAEEEFERLVRRQEGVEQLQAKYQQARRRVEQVAGELETLQEQLQEKADRGEEISAEDRERLERLAKRMEDEAEALETLRKKNELPYELDRELAKELEPLADKLREMAQELRKRSGQEEQTTEQLAQALSEMQDQLQQERQEFDDNVTEPLELLAGVLELMQDQARFTELYRQQESLAERLASLRKRDGEDNPPMQRRMRDLEAEQERIRNELADLLNDIESHAAQLPEREELEELREQAQDFCKACRASGAAESMRDAEMGLAEFSGPKGYDGAKDAQEKLEELLEKSDELQSGAGQGMQRSLSFKPSLGRAAMNTLEQLLAEAGLSPGQSPGMSGLGGGRGGRSARRNSLDNVGLYGGTPQEEPRSSSMQAEQAHRQQGKFARTFGGDEREPENGVEGLGQGSQASGRAEALAPPTYRRRVAAYFERVVEELND
jgi:hypothetical protein